MLASLILPMVVAVGAGFSAGLVQRRLPPRLATWLLTGVAVVLAAAVVWAVGTLAVGWLSQQPVLADWLGWCRVVVTHHASIPGYVGLPSLILLSAMIVSGARTTRSVLRATRAPRDGDDIEFIATDEPIAYALPGRPGQVVISTGMLRCLRAGERTVLLAHEEAHLRYRHHRFMAASTVSAAMVPFLRPLRAQVRFGTERWADEVAAAHVGDRQVTARAVARAALATADHAAALAFGGLGVAARVEALLAEPPGRPCADLATSAGVTAAVAAAVAAAVQLHHLVQLALHACTA